MQNCIFCGKKKKIQDFYKNPRMRSGYVKKCKECTLKILKKSRKDNPEKYRRYDRVRQRINEGRMFGHRYTGMAMRENGSSIHRSSAYGKGKCTRKEFIEWCRKKENYLVFLKLFEAWKAGGFKRKDTPSIDRIDNKKGYQIENLQWLTQSENTKKDWDRQKSGLRKRDIKGKFVL